MNRPEEPVLVAIGIVRRGDEFLVGIRPEGVPLAGLAEFPGGKCQPDETPEACVVRECAEETGLNVIVRGRRAEVEHTYKHGPVRLVFFECAVESGMKPLAPFRFVSRKELGRLTFPVANRTIIAQMLVWPSESR